LADQVAGVSSPYPINFLKSPSTFAEYSLKHDFLGLKMKKARQIFTLKVGQANCKVNRANSKVNRANPQSRLSGILFAIANGKLYFEALKTF